MYCSRCGNQYEAIPNFCRVCGQAIGGAVPATGPARFESLRRLTTPLVVGLGLVIAFDILLAAINIERISLANRIIAGESYREVEADFSALVYQIVNSLYVLPFLMASIVFMIWIYRASRNLEPLGCRNQKYSPGWAVGWFFIPLANLVMPFLVTREIWKGSDPRYPDGVSWLQAPLSAVVPAWWTLNVIGLLLGGPALLAFTDDSATGLLAESWIYLIGNVVEIGAAVLFILLVRRVTSRQDEKGLSLPA